MVSLTINNMDKRIYICKSTDDIFEVLPNEVINDEENKYSISFRYWSTCGETWHEIEVVDKL